MNKDEPKILHLPLSKKWFDLTDDNEPDQLTDHETESITAE
jgi:hypothetical protein